MAQVALSITPTEDVPRVQVSIYVQTEVIGGEVARRRANVWLLEHVGNLVGAESPLLVLGEPLTWRVDVMPSSPAKGTVGWLGRLEVHAVTGEVLADEVLAEELAARADAFPAH